MVVRFLIFWGVNTLLLWTASQLFPKTIYFSNFSVLLVSGLLFGLANTFVRPLLVFLTLPLTLITLGLFLFVVNTLVLLLVAWIVPGFDVAGFWPGLLVAVFISILGFVVNKLLGRS